MREVRLAKDLRTFVNDLEKRDPNDIVRVKREIDPRYEVTDVQYKLEQRLKYPLLIFENIKNLKGDKSRFPLITSIYIIRQRMALALNSTVQGLMFEYGKRLKNPIKPQNVSKKEAPVKEVVRIGEEADLNDFPVLTHSYMDGGPYITHGIVTTVDPDAGDLYNNAFQRLQIKEPRKMGVYMHEYGGNYRRLSVYEKRNEPMPVAIWLGHHPAASMGSLAAVPLDVDEYEIIGGILGEPLRVTQSETWGDRMLVPADAEIIIEGIIPPRVREPEGPFGDWSGHQGPQRYQPVIEVKAITHRADAYFPDVWPAARWTRQDQGASTPGRECAIYEAVKRVVPTVKNVHIPDHGFGFIVYIQIKKTAPGQGKLAFMATLPMHAGIKYAIVVDEDVDIFNDSEVLWALGTRTQPDRDIVPVSNMSGNELDPSTKTVIVGERTFALTGKLGIDATKPVEPQPWPMRMHIPEEVSEKIEIESFIDKEQIDKIPIRV